MATRKLDKPRQIRHGISDLSRLTHRQQPVFELPITNAGTVRPSNGRCCGPRAAVSILMQLPRGDGRGGGEKLMDRI